MLHLMKERSRQLMMAAGLTVGAGMLVISLFGVAGSASAQTVPTAPPPTEKPHRAQPTDTKAPPPAPTFTATSTSAPTEAPTDTAVPTSTPLPPATASPLPPTLTTAPSPTPLPAASGSAIPTGWFVGIGLLILALLVVGWLIARRRPNA